MAAMVNGTSGTPASDIASPATAMPASGKQPSKAAVNTASKNGDLGRKQNGSPSDGSQSRSVPPRAWTTGKNPITQRTTNAGQQNGASQPNKTGPKSTTTQDTKSEEKARNDRVIYGLGNLMGHTVSITTKHGDAFSGVFFGATLENEPAYLLKMVQQTKHAEKSGIVNGVKDAAQDYTGIGDDHSMSFEVKDIAFFSVEGATFSAQQRQNGSTTGFRTDTDISGNMALRERELKRWTPSEETNVDMSLEDSNGNWDQFKANEELFGLKSDYDENIYTTTLDRNTPQYRQNEAKAQRIAREIEGNISNNAHIREERGLADEEGDMDEEDKYSGVRREVADYPPLQSSNPNRYMPPARRPPSGQATVPGAPVDPAIISSSMARPDASPQRTKDAASSKAGNNTGPVKAGDVASVEAKQGSTKEPASAKAARPSDAPKASVPNATANVETEVLDSFRTFAEKQKTKVADDRQKRARHDKDIKLNDLKSFSNNFKLHTPVPKDLVPILAKDKKKQDEILEKARREAEQQSAIPPKIPKAGEEPSARPPPEAKRDGTRGMPNSVERQDFSQYRGQFPPRGPNRQNPGQYGSQTSPQGNGNSGYLSHRMADNQRHKPGMSVIVPAPLPIPGYQKPPSKPGNNAAVVPNSQTSSTVRTPTSAASKNFNVNAIEFKPNPAASTFQPIGPPIDAASPRVKGAARVKEPRASSPSAFFGEKKPLSPSERPSVLEHFNPLKRLSEKAEKESKSKDYTTNGGIINAYATPVTWSVLKDDEDTKSYKDMFNDPPVASTGVSPHPTTTSPMNPNQAHLPQMPAHLHQQGMPQPPNPNHGPYQGPPQQHLFQGNVPGGPHQFDDHRMHGSPSTPSYATPRMQNNFVPYASPMGPGAQYPYGQPMPPHMMGPSGPQPPNFRQYPNGPQYMPSPGQQLAAPMMVQQGSQGNYMAPQGMGVPHMQMYGQGPAPSYNGPSQPPSGYPSPSRGAPMMMHQGSYQGQTPPMHPGGGQYGAQPFYAQQPPPHMNPMRGYPSPQPHYSQSPQQQYHYPPQPQRMPSQGGYGQHPPQGGPQHVPVQQGPPPGGPMEGGEGMK